MLIWSLVACNKSFRLETWLGWSAKRFEKRFMLFQSPHRLSSSIVPDIISNPFEELDRRVYPAAVVKVGAGPANKKLAP